MLRGIGRRGQVMVMFPAVLIGLCCVAALTIDIGGFCARRASLQNGADASALAAMMEIWEHRCASAGEPNSRAAATVEADRLRGLNCPGARMEIVYGLYDGAAFEPVDDSVLANACRVTQVRDGAAPGRAQGTFFGPLFGVPSANVRAAAVASFLRASNLVPFCVFEGDVPPVGEVMTVYDDTLVVPGVFGLIDYNGGENSADDLNDWMANGFNEDLYIDPRVGSIDLEGQTGWVDSLHQPIADHINEGDYVIGCIYRSVTGTGENTIFEVIGFVKMVLLAQGHDKVDGDPRKYIDAQVEGVYIIGQDNVYGELYRFMNLQLRD
jgi:hypothetical protein